MTAGIGGQTVHSWACISFQNKDGISVVSGVVRKGKDDVEQMHVKCAKQRFLFVDECECEFKEEDKSKKRSDMSYENRSVSMFFIVNELGRTSSFYLSQGFSDNPKVVVFFS